MFPGLLSVQIRKLKWFSRSILWIPELTPTGIGEAPPENYNKGQSLTLLDLRGSWRRWHPRNSGAEGAGKAGSRVGSWLTVLELWRRLNHCRRYCPGQTEKNRARTPWFLHTLPTQVHEHTCIHTCARALSRGWIWGRQISEGLLNS